MLFRRLPVKPNSNGARYASSGLKKKSKEVKATFALHNKASRIMKKENVLSGVVKDTMTLAEKYAAIRKVCSDSISSVIEFFARYHTTSRMV